MMQWKKGLWAICAAAVFGLAGCGNEVITVADIHKAEEAAQEYIEVREFELKEQEAVNGRQEVQYCAVMIPEGYVESEEVPGMYLHEKAPLDSSNVYYTVSEGIGGGSVSDSLTEAEYEKAIEGAFQESGQDIDLQVASFEEVDMNGVPAYKIRSSYGLGENTIEQLTYLILAKDTYTVTYSQSEDDELMADFEISDGQIKLVKEENVELASSGASKQDES